MTAPDKIWATEDAENFGEDKFHTAHGPMKGLTEYTRADLAQAAVAAAYEAAAQAVGWEAYVADTSPQYLSDWQRGLVAGQQAMCKAIHALATPDQIAALKAVRAADQAEITRLRAVIAKDAAQMIEDQHKMHKAVEVLRFYGDIANWCARVTVNGPGDVDLHAPVMEADKHGKTARAALAEIVGA